MVIESKRIFTLAISALVICLAISFALTSTVFVSGCVQQAPTEQEEKPSGVNGAVEGRGTECPVGTTVTSSGMETKVTGIEKHTIKGKTMNLCCGETRMQGTSMLVKTCADRLVDHCYSTTLLPDGGYYISYPEEDNICSEQFDASGNLVYQKCVAREGDCQ